MNFYDTVERLFHDWNYSTPRMLYALVKMYRPQVIVESGTYRGLSACWMAKAVQENNCGRVHCIDNFSLKEHVERYGDPRAHLEGNLRACGIRDWVEILEGDADKVEWPESVDMIYIDGWHSHAAAKYDFEKAASLGARIIGLDDTENCVGPRLFAESVDLKGWQRMHFHSDNGLTLFVREEEKRSITFSQELPDNPGVDLRFMSVEQQHAHFEEAWKVTGLDYSPIMDKTEHDRKVGT